MRKLAFVLLAVATLTTACKEKKQEATVAPAANEVQLDTETAIVNWIGYKFTNKKGVKGQFQKINISNNHPAKTMIEALNGVEFSIPVSSLFSNNGVRDAKLKSLFFGMMDNTEMLSGKVTSVTETGGVIALKMNNETHDLPFTLQTQGKTSYLNGTIDLNVWNAGKAWASIHKACELLHTGEDGVSKTWKVVDVDAVLNFK